MSNACRETVCNNEPSSRPVTQEPDGMTPAPPADCANAANNIAQAEIRDMAAAASYTDNVWSNLR